MTPEERDIISRFIARVGGAPSGGAFSGGGQTPALPPIDPEADRFIGEQFTAYPEARYRITQLAFVQEAALAQAQNRIRALETQLQQAQAQQSQAGQSRGFFGGLFGGGPQTPPPNYAPPPSYAPPPASAYPSGYQPGMFQRGGSGFLGSALTTAAGVAGGVLAADAITSLFSGGHGYGGGFGGGFGAPGEVVNETIVNNYGDAANAADPWAGAGQADPGGAWGGGGGDPGADPWAGGGQADPGGDPWGGAGQGDPGDGGGGWDDQGGGDSGIF